MQSSASCVGWDFQTMGWFRCIQPRLCFGCDRLRRLRSCKRAAAVPLPGLPSVVAPTLAALYACFSLPSPSLCHRRSISWRHSPMALRC
jgi:hypothetical protein